MSDLSWILKHPVDVQEFLIGVGIPPHVGIGSRNLVYSSWSWFCFFLNICDPLLSLHSLHWMMDWWAVSYHGFFPQFCKCISPMDRLPDGWAMVGTVSAMRKYSLARLVGINRQSWGSLTFGKNRKKEFNLRIESFRIYYFQAKLSFLLKIISSLSIVDFLVFLRISLFDIDIYPMNSIRKAPTFHF